MIKTLRHLLVIFAILALSQFAFNGCGYDGGGGTADIPTITSGTTTDEGSGSEVTQEINDKLATDKEFDFNTSTPVELALTIKDLETDQAVPRTIITVYDDKEDVITSGITNAEGIALLTIISENANGSVTVVTRHNDYGEYKIVVSDIKKLSSIDRMIKVKKMKKSDSAIPVDSDNDGVADTDDQFPNDANYVKAVKGEFTLVFEDLYPSKGDADFNDAVVKLTITEKINAQNKVVSITLSAQAIASGAGYNNQFGVYVLDREYLLISNFKNDLDNHWNAKKGEIKGVPGPVRTEEIVLETPMERNQLSLMPYDPFLIPNGVNAGKKNGEVHLPSVKTAYQGKVKDSDGFPWALVVPGNWAWPYERVDIRMAYPDFKTWYESGGQQAADWYLNPAVDQVYPYYDESSSLTAFIMGTSSGNRVLIIIVLIALITVIGGLFLLNRRRYNLTSR